MSLTDDEINLEKEKLKLEDRRVAVLEKEHQSLSKKSIFLNTTVIVALISISLPLVSFIAELGKTARAEIIREKQLENDNSKYATQVYFDNIDSFACSTTEDSSLVINRLKFLNLFSGTNELGAILNNMQEICARVAVPTQTDSIIAAGLPTISSDAELLFNTGYTVFIQYPSMGTCKSTAEMLQSALFNIGFKTPGIQAVNVSPDTDQIRFYSSEQQTSLQSTLSQLTLANNQSILFEFHVLRNNLPEDVFEVWVGKDNNCAN